MNEIKKLNKRYDHVLVGYNFASLSRAYQLHSQGEDFCIIDSRHISLKPTKHLASISQAVYSRVPFAPLTENFDISPSLENLLGSKTINESTPTTFDKGEFKSFLGFGETKIDEIEVVSNYCATQNFQFAGQPENLWQKFTDAVEDRVFLDQQVTDVEFESKEITGLVLNGKTKITAQHYTFFGYFPFLFEKVGSEIKSLASKMAKVKWWSSATLIIHHQTQPEKTEWNQLYLLKGSKEQPCLGSFAQIEGHTISRWESFFPAELTRDSETTGSLIKEIKKQVKRAFQEPSDSKSSEHILVHDVIYGDLSKLGLNSGKLGDFSNLYVCSPLFQGHMGWLAEVSAAWDLSVSEKVQENSLDEVAAPPAP